MRSRRPIVVLPLICLATMLLAADAASAAFPGANGKIAFYSDRTTAGTWTMTSTGGSQTRLAGTATTDRQPAWSPDGSRIAFFRGGQIYWMYANGTGLTQVTYLGASDLGLDWSPDGTKIAFVHNRSGNNEVYSINATNSGSESGLVNVSNTSDRSDFEPSWRPTGGGTGGGNQIAYQQQGGASNDIYVKTSNGTGSPTQLTTDTGSDGQPDWSPDGARIAFRSDRAGGTSHDIWTMNANGSSQIQRTTAPGAEEQPAWSPDGGSIAFQRTSGSASPEIMTMDIGTTGVGTSITNRSNNAAIDTHADWQVADTAAPNTTINSGPADGSTSNSTSASFGFTSTEAGSTFECSLDGAAFSSCTSPRNLSGLSDASHTFQVRAIDPNGNVDPTPASRTFTVDTIAPETTIDSGPTENETVGDSTPTFTFSSSEPSGATFQCRFDTDTFQTCTSPYTPPSALAQGGHTFEVRATDAAGNTDASPAIRSFSVQTATVGFSGSAILYNSPVDEENDLTIVYVDDPGGDYYEITEGNGSIELNAATDCTRQSQNVIRCPGDSQATGVQVALGPGDDELDASGVSGAGSDPLTVTGNAGDDTIAGGANDDYLEGADGSDTLIGNGGNDILVGGNDGGTDRMSGGPGDDQLDGGPGIDRALYGDSTGPVSVSMDNFANDADGLGGTDNVLDTVESITGGPDDDELTGSCFANTLAGQGGNDTLNGDPGSCVVYGGDFMGGGSGDDEFNGGPGGPDQVTYTTNGTGQGIDVSLNGVADDDDGLGGTDDIGGDIEYVFGGAGDDTIDASLAGQGVSLWGRAGDDILIGSGFNDYLRGELGSDTLDCGGDGNDMYDVDPADPPAVNCETAG